MSNRRRLILFAALISALMVELVHSGSWTSLGEHWYVAELPLAGQKGTLSAMMNPIGGTNSPFHHEVRRVEECEAKEVVAIISGSFNGPGCDLEVSYMHAEYDRMYGR